MLTYKLRPEDLGLKDINSKGYSPTMYQKGLKLFDKFKHLQIGSVVTNDEIDEVIGLKDSISFFPEISKKWRERCAEIGVYPVRTRGVGYTIVALNDQRVPISYRKRSHKARRANKTLAKGLVKQSAFKHLVGKTLKIAEVGGILIGIEETASGPKVVQLSN